MKDYIYIVIAQNGLFKIGETTSVPERFAQIKSANACNVEPFFYFEGSPEFEKELHILFAKKRVRGEWFALDYEDLKSLVEIANEKIPLLNRNYILRLIDEMNAWGFFELGKYELAKNVSQAALYRCSVAMNPKVEDWLQNILPSGIDGSV